MQAEISKILLIADSYALPRLACNSEKVELSYQQAYPEQLRQNLRKMLKRDVLLVSLAEHAQVTICLQAEMRLQVRLLQPDYVIVQLGLADLWPANPQRVSSRYAQLQGRDPWVTAEEYLENLRGFAQFYQQEMASGHLIVVNIPWVAAEQYWRYPKAYERTVTYNAGLAGLITKNKLDLLDWYSSSKQLGVNILSPDGIHLNGVGSRILAQALAEKILA